MSSRFRFVAPCPSCGLKVACNGEGKFRAHNRQLADANMTTAACYVAPVREHEAREAAQHRRAAAPARREYWEARENKPSVLPPHLR